MYSYPAFQGGGACPGIMGGLINVPPPLKPLKQHGQYSPERFSRERPITPRGVSLHRTAEEEQKNSRDCASQLGRSRTGVLCTGYTCIYLRALSTLRGLRGAPEVPPLCRETQSLGQQMLNAPLGINGLKDPLKPSDEEGHQSGPHYASCRTDEECPRIGDRSCRRTSKAADIVVLLKVDIDVFFT